MRLDGEPILRALPVKDHRVDFQIHPSTFTTRAVCQCRWTSLFWDTAAQAADEWRDHVELDK